MTAPAIEIERLGKLYRIGTRTERPDTLGGTLAGWLSAPLTNFRRLRRLSSSEEGEDSIWALRDLSFSVAQGEALGVIGHNGAGKSTLLKILSRITMPTEGRATLRGRVGSLLEVGTGFHPDLTGRENIYLNGAILGMKTPEINRQFDDIVSFAGVEKFVDTPVKRFSSGMYLRLAFAVAAHLETEILLVDEVLAVGDHEFQKRCLGRIDRITRQGRTVLFVSHNLSAVDSVCSRAVVLRSGRVDFDGATEDAIRHYLSYHLSDRPTTALEKHEGRVTRGPAILRSLSILDSDGSERNIFRLDEDVAFRVRLTAADTYRQGVVSISLNDVLGRLIVVLKSDMQSRLALPTRGSLTIECVLKKLRIAPGRYFVSVGFADGRTSVDQIESATSLDVVAADVWGTGQQQRIGSVMWVPDADWRVVESGEAR